MKVRKKIIGTLLFLLTVILCWQYGLFNRFNYFTAKIDGWRDQARLVTVGPPAFSCGVPCIGLKEKYGFHESNVDCLLTEPTIRGIDAYNEEIERYLEERNGTNWREKYQAEFDLMIENHEAE